jgi:hypothetical protein
MSEPKDVTVFIPDDETKERLERKCNEIVNNFSNLPMHEIGFVLQTLVETFQEAHKCYIPIHPQKVNLLVNFKR